MKETWAWGSNRGLFLLEPVLWVLYALRWTLSQVWHGLNFRYILAGYVDSSAHWEKLGITHMLYNVQILYCASGSKKLLLLFLESWKITLKHPSMFDIFLQSQGLI